MARSEDFNGGFDAVRSPQFESVQQQGNRNFEATSILDNIMPNQNGMGSRDFQRRLVGSQGSLVGRSDETFDKQLWLRHPEPSNRAKTVRKE